jgi:hypothetical protein
MSIPWEISASVNNAASVYPAWVGTNYTRHHNRLCLCNWFPLSILVEFAEIHGFRLNLNYWRGSASTAPDAVRAWNTANKLVRDSHGGDFDSKQAFKRKVESTVTARMIGELNTISIASTDIRIGDLLLRNYSNRYWHAELIVKIDKDVITTEAGSTPKVKPNTNINFYNRENLAAGKPLYQDGPRRWDFSNLITTS